LGKNNVAKNCPPLPTHVSLRNALLNVLRKEAQPLLAPAGIILSAFHVLLPKIISRWEGKSHLSVVLSLKSGWQGPAKQTADFELQHALRWVLPASNAGGVLRFKSSALQTSSASLAQALGAE